MIPGAFNGEQWVKSKLRWQTPSGSFDFIPWDFLASGEPISEERRALALTVADDMNRRIANHGDAVIDELRRSAHDYALRSMIRIPREGKREVTRESSPPPSQITAFTFLQAGNYKYVVDFRSSDYPALEQLMTEMEALVVQREETMREILAQ